MYVTASATARLASSLIIFIQHYRKIIWGLKRSSDPLQFPILNVISTDRVQKLKDARAEAAKEIEAYRAQKDKDFTTFESEVSDRGIPVIVASETLISPW